MVVLDSRVRCVDSENDSVAGEEPRGAKEVPWQTRFRTGTVLIRNDALLPAELKFESEPCVEGWVLVKNFDGRGWDREIQRNGWTSFCLGREIRASVFGIDGEKMTRRVIGRILTGATEEFNLLEVTRVASVGSQRFPLPWYVTVSAQPRYISRRLLSYLCPPSREPTRGEA
jgi:hypothetical protein